MPLAPDVPISASEDMGADVLSDVLRAVRLSGALFFLTDASTPWSVAVPEAGALTSILHPRAQHLISYHVVTSGCCWCHTPGMPPLFLGEGDVVVIPHGHAYGLSQPSGHPNDWTRHDILEFFRAMAAPDHPFVVTEGGGEAEGVKVLCGFLGCDVRPFNPVFGALPPLLHVPRSRGGNGDHLGHLVDFTMQESLAREAGTECVLLRLGELMFMQVVRQYLASVAPGQTGWLAGLRDPVVGRALAILHRRPEHPWTLPSLAREVSQSRSVLAERFKHYVGTPPMQYLARWRMQVAARMLADGDAKVGAIAAAVGYESPAAFNRAFRRATGVPPAAWRARRG
jgi:AraC-like DNA-binding protein